MKWDAPRGKTRTVAFLKQISKTCAALGGPDANGLNALMQSDNFKEVIDYEINYEEDASEDRTRDIVYSRQIKALVEKQDFLDLGYDKTRVAFEAFLAAEQKCLETNERLRSPCPEKDVSAVLHYAQRKISEILGDVPKLEDLCFLFGPGASTNVGGTIANSRSKLSANLACSEDFVSTVGKFLEEFPLWATECASHIDYSVSVDSETIIDLDDYVAIVPIEVHRAKLAFVPKNSKTDRPICVEPVLNALMQKGLGTHMKKRLARFGVNLRDQGRNQDLAKQGSINGSLATIDLSSASDTVAYNLVLDLLPFPWFEILSSCRSGQVCYQDSVITLEKFSSMGNGYTFELESLLFYGLAFGVQKFLECEGPISVYGDDIIVPSTSFDLMVKVLNYCGFSTNVKKSFNSGFFRESCGADWYAGFDVRPFYLREEISDRVLFSSHNFFVRKGERELARVCLSWTQKRLRTWGPDGFGDGHLVGSYFLRVSREHRRRGFEGGTFRTYVSNKRVYNKPLRRDSVLPSYVSYASAARQASLNSLDQDMVRLDPYTVRGNKGYRLTSIYTANRGVFIP
jgi:hypothetical protein